MNSLDLNRVFPFRVWECFSHALCYFLKSLTVSARVNTTEGMPLLGSLGATPFCNSHFLWLMRTNLLSPEAFSGPLGNGTLFTGVIIYCITAFNTAAAIYWLYYQIWSRWLSKYWGHILDLYLIANVILYFCSTNIYLLGYSPYTWS